MQVMLTRPVCQSLLFLFVSAFTTTAEPHGRPMVDRGPRWSGQSSGTRIRDLSHASWTVHIADPDCSIGDAVTRMAVFGVLTTLCFGGATLCFCGLRCWALCCGPATVGAAMLQRPRALKVAGLIAAAGVVFLALMVKAGTDLVGRDCEHMVSSGPVFDDASHVNLIATSKLGHYGVLSVTAGGLVRFFRKVPGVGAGQTSFPMPTIDGDYLYFKNGLQVTCVDLLQGSLQWQAPVRSCSFRGSQALLVHQGIIVLSAGSLGSCDGFERAMLIHDNKLHLISGFTVVGMNASDGSIMWVFRPDHALGVFRPTTSSQGSVLFTDFFGGLYCLELTTGKLQWQIGAEPPSDVQALGRILSNMSTVMPWDMLETISYFEAYYAYQGTFGPAVSPDGIVYIAGVHNGNASTSSTYEVRAHKSSDGSLLSKWVGELPRREHNASYVISAPALVDSQSRSPGSPAGLLIFGVSQHASWGTLPPGNSSVFALNVATGEVSWSFSPLGSHGRSTPPDDNCLPRGWAHGWTDPLVSSDGSVFIGHFDTGLIYELDGATGAMQGLINMTSSLAGGPALGNGLLAVASCTSLVAA